MAEERFDEPTEQATPRKREEARERGQVAKSQDLNSAVILLAAVLAFQFFGAQYVDGLAGGTTRVLEGMWAIDGERENLLLHYGSVVVAALWGMLPFLILVVVAALGVNLLQVGFLFSGEALTPDLKRLNPVEGIKKMFSMRSFVRLLIGLFKISAVGAAVFLTMWGERERLMTLSGMAFEDVLTYGTGVVLLASIRAVLVLLVIAILEFGYQRWQHDKDLRMTKTEVKEELKRYEGDPKIRERRRAIQRQLALQRMMQQVPKATVVITNPTHVAVALEYRQKEMDAPVVIAKGAELLAARIRTTAMEHGVPIVERPELARALYKGAEVGQKVPYELYQTVAEVLAYVYRLKGMAAAAA